MSYLATFLVRTVTLSLMQGYNRPNAYIAAQGKYSPVPIISYYLILNSTLRFYRTASEYNYRFLENGMAVQAKNCNHAD